MGSFSDYSEDAILDHITGRVELTKPTAFVGLCTADPTDTGSGSSCHEVTLGVNAYARVATASGDWNTASGGSIDNKEDITFPECATGAWGTVTHFALFDGSGSAANMLAHSALSPTKHITIGDTPKFAGGALGVGALEMTLD